MTTSHRRPLRPSVLVMCCVLGMSSTVFAQTAEVSIYADFELSDSVVDAYVELIDSTDFSQWNGQAYHYNYSGGVEISGNGGSDQASGSGLGPFNLQIPYSGDDDEYYADFGIGFTCSISGPLSASAWGIFMFRMKAFNLWYDRIEEGAPYYQPTSGSSGRMCAASTMTFQPATPTMTCTGVAMLAFNVFGTCKYLIGGSGHYGNQVGDYGYAAVGSGVCPTGN